MIVRMTTKHTSIRLSPDDRRLLDRRAAEEGVSRSGLIRLLLRRGSIGGVVNREHSDPDVTIDTIDNMY